MAVTYEPIASTTLGSDAASYEFTGIPGTYTDLICVVRVRSTKASGEDSYTLQVGNSSVDTGSNYSRTRLFGDGSAANSGRSSSQANIGMEDLPVANATADTFGVNVVQFMSYANTNVYKTILYANAANGTSYIFRSVGLWRSTSAITNVKFSATSGNNFKAGSTFSLFGVKAA
jgi:hypothetical protein